MLNGAQSQKSSISRYKMTWIFHTCLRIFGPIEPSKHGRVSNIRFSPSQTWMVIKWFNCEDLLDFLNVFHSYVSDPDGEMIHFVGTVPTNESFHQACSVRLNHPKILCIFEHAQLSHTSWITHWFRVKMLQSLRLHKLPALPVNLPWKDQISEGLMND